MADKRLTWTPTNLRAATSPEDVRTAISEAATQLGGAALPASVVLSFLEELALDGARLRSDLYGTTRARDLLLASVAHDLRNPLNTFAMSSGLLRDDLEGPELDRTRALSLLARMERATARMQSLIEDLLEASRIEGGSVEVARRPEQAAAVVRAAIAKVRPLCTEKGATIEEAAIDDGAMVELDKARSIDALSRLAAVCLKSTGEGGAIRMGVERHEADLHFTIRAATPRGGSCTPPHDEVRGGLAFFIGRGLVAAQGGRLLTEATQEGPRTVVAFPAA